MFITYECPDSLHCGEWDYVDHIYLEIDSAQHLELARMISPYGWRFDSAWKFSWHVDVTDFSHLLRDTANIVFRHTGYENNKDRGWLVTLNFEIITGKPVREFVGMDTLWQGSFPYGDSTRPIEQLLDARTIEPPPGAEMARLHIIQTGHGMDSKQICAEFCPKYRQIYLDDSLVDQKLIWRECGSNPLYPQAGTWIFDRAGWCPGEVVYPDVYDFVLSDAKEHTINLDMQPYHNPKDPTASWLISACVIYYSKPVAKHDVSIVEIISPCNVDKYRRFNPSCFNPTIVIKNNGREILRSLDIEYGTGGNEKYTLNWDGEIKPLATDTIELDMAFTSNDNGRPFLVHVSKPNGKKDAFGFDNSLATEYVLPAFMPGEFILDVRTNNESTHNFYYLMDQEGKLILTKPLDSLKPNTIYLDTLYLNNGCYELFVGDTAGDGLNFWFNSEGGHGYVRLLDMEERLIKSFNSDFGNEIRYSFVVDTNFIPEIMRDGVPIINLFPPRNQGIFDLFLFFNEETDISLEIMASDSTRTVFQKSISSFKDGIIPLDITGESDGLYLVSVKHGEDQVTRRTLKRNQ